MTLPGFTECKACLGSGYKDTYTDLQQWTVKLCSDCQGTGQVPDDLTVEVAADGIADLPFDTLELRNWGEESVAGPYIVAARAALVAYAKRHGRKI